jgi:hypothetical protein
MPITEDKKQLTTNTEGREPLHNLTQYAMKLDKFYYDNEGNDYNNWRKATKLDIVSPEFPSNDEETNKKAFNSVLRAAEKFVKTHRETVEEWTGPDRVDYENGSCIWECTIIKG